MTREVLPGLARQRGWPVERDHCFQRLLLDAAAGGVWYDHVQGRPAYRHAPLPLITDAVRLARGARDGDVDVRALNARSLAWRAGRRPGR